MSARRVAPPHATVTVELHHDWADVALRAGDTFHLLADVIAENTPGSKVACGLGERQGQDLGQGYEARQFEG